jgi:uncharacterized protein
MATSQSEGKGKQGFASMDEGKQKEIASKGGKASYKNDSQSSPEDDEEEESQSKGANSNKSSAKSPSKDSSDSPKSNSKDDEDNGRKGKQGFASMEPEKQKEIASKGGKASHK